MRYKWLNKQNNKNFILFLNGWGMDESAVYHLKNEGFDILAFNDYRKFDLELTNMDFSGYTRKYLVAWSMGVYVSGIFSNVLNNFDKKIAIAGTQKIIDNNFGIPNKIYNCTVKFFNDKSKEKFIENIFLNEKQNFKISKSTNELKEELIAIQNLKVDSSIDYDKAIVATNDIIVPYKNQLNFWQTKVAEIVEIKAPHYIFNNFKGWFDIIC